VVATAMPSDFAGSVAVDLAAAAFVRHSMGGTHQSWIYMLL
jgi:hypothetical protein